QYKLSVQKTVAFSVERERILSFFESQGIWYLPMKGIILQNYYPEIGMRQMADNDFFFDIERRGDVRDYMVDHGYEAKTYGMGVHDTYVKKPFYNFEMHAYLYRESVNKAFDVYYNGAKEMLIKDEDNCYGFHFSDEDFYIHMITHIFKHYDHGGLGFRFLADVYVYLKRNEAKLDWEYIPRELDKLQIKEFEEKVRKLSQKLFSDKCVNLRDDPDYLTDEESLELSYYIKSGIYGTKEKAIRSKIRKLTGSEEKTAKGKAKYILRRLFPSMLYYKENYPFLYKYKIFIPFFWVFRTVRGLFVRRNQTKNEMKMLNRKI
ncbi:MAG: nucleotidyltransferase family protein, partial [Clostridia bacterium]|nr:nucleotidyltransferase family protein [Clostridia bacterium]